MAANGQAFLEFEQLDSLLEAAGVDGVREIMSAFWRSSDSLTSGLNDSLNLADAGSAARAAHALKGSAANVGAVRLAECARDIETWCKSGDLASAKTALGTLASIYAETKSAVETHLASRT